jgi:MHS family proline/betaine transporter-like MFS transporter
MQSPSPPGRTRAIVATSIGNTLEWYDFVVYAQFAAYIAGNFFPGADANTRLLKAFLAFGVGFLVRPLGAVLIGGYGDRVGRKAALTFTIFLMALGTGVIAFSPTYAAIGIGAPILLLLGRVLQGLSAGGEVGGATAYLFESAPPRQRGMISAWLQASMGMANIVGAVVAFSVTALLGSNAVGAWGWRIPFIFGLLIVPAGLFLRRSLEETQAFQVEAARRGHSRPAPWREVFRDHGRGLCVGLCIAALWAVASYVLVIFMPTYVQRPDTYGFTARQAFGASVLGNIPLVIGCIYFGHLSDRIGRRTMLRLSALLLFVCVIPLFMWLRAVPTTTTLILFQSALCALVSTIGGVAPAALAEIFPTSVRTTGTAMVYNAAFALFGGFAPAILTWLTQRPGGALFAPAWYVMLAATLALIAIPFLEATESVASPGRNVEAARTIS